jgi:hypothetical protein
LAVLRAEQEVRAARHRDTDSDCKTPQSGVRHAARRTVGERRSKNQQRCRQQ